MCQQIRCTTTGFNMNDSFKIIKNFISVDRCNQMVAKLDDFYAKGLHLSPDTQCTISPAFYGIFNDESVEFLPEIEKITGKKLYPTYTYSRIYQRNEILLPHTDREECEYSFSLALKYDNDVWPFFMQTKSSTEILMLEPGDIVIYKGTENLHWRMRLEDQFCYQAFFHYVDQQGYYKHRKYDGKSKFYTTDEATDELIRKNHVLQR